MLRNLLIVTLLFLAACVGDIARLERAVISRAEKDSATAENYFLSRIEAGATYEEQAVYMYGIGISYERQGNTAEAMNSYLSAEALGNAAATRALQRLQGKP